MVNFIKGEGGGNDFVLMNYNPKYDYSKLAVWILNRRYGVGGDGLVVMNGKKMKFYNPDGSNVPFCGNAVRVFFRLLYMKGKVKEKDEIETESGIVQLVYNKNGTVSALMPPLKILERRKKGAIVECGVPHYVIPVNDVDKINLQIDGPKLSNAIPGRNNVDWFREENGFVYMRVFERGVEGETLSCSSGIASVSFFVMEETGKNKLKVKMRGGEFETERESENRLWLTGEANIVFKGSLLKGVPFAKREKT
ncbi:MAG: diaminopimelate epimerase [candidate division WOR-3 bacterium]